jgi:hypothetical protein
VTLSESGQGGGHWLRPPTGWSGKEQSSLAILRSWEAKCEHNRHLRDSDNRPHNARVIRAQSSKDYLRETFGFLRKSARCVKPMDPAKFRPPILRQDQHR